MCTALQLCFYFLAVASSVQDLTPGFELRDSLLLDSEDHMGCRKLDLGWMYARQMLYLLYLSKVFFLKTILD